MNFRFEARKATEVACAFIKLEGGQINIMKLVKLIYLLDRLSIDRRGIPVVGGRYFSMRNGPVISEVLDLINAGAVEGSKDCRWNEYITARQGYDVGFNGEFEPENLAPSVMQLVQEIHKEHGQRDQWQLSDWCHQRCEEWTPLDEGRQMISVEQIGRALGKSDMDIVRLAEDAQESLCFARLFCPA
jgi:uncharacterized phage-associated protein